MARPWPKVKARKWVQSLFFFWTLLIGGLFALWAFAHLAGKTPPVSRPAGVEGFLPISALLSLRWWLAGGGVHPVHPAGLAIFLAALLMSALVARSFCSHLCPIGALSEWLGNLGRKLLGQTWNLPRLVDIPLRGLKWLVLGFFLWATWFSMSLPQVRAFLDSPYNRVVDVKMLLFFAEPSRLTLAVLGVLVVASILVRDFWCRYLCPYGALVGLLGTLAFWKITRDPQRCTSCGLCAKVCPARLPVHRLKRVTSVECTACQDCVAACPVKGCLSLQGLNRPVRPAQGVLLALSIYLAVTLTFRLLGHWRGAVSETEYATRLRQIHSPLYTHGMGTAPQEGPSGAQLYSSH
jgi:polyferredoxin